MSFILEGGFGFISMVEPYYECMNLNRRDENSCVARKQQGLAVYGGIYLYKFKNTLNNDSYCVADDLLSLHNHKHKHKSFI